MIKICEEAIQRYKSAFGDRLQELLINEKSLLQWCNKHNIPHATVTNWINKRSLPSIEYFVELAKEFGVTIDYLIGLED